MACYGDDGGGYRWWHIDIPGKPEWGGWRSNGVRGEGERGSQGRDSNNKYQSVELDALERAKWHVLVTVAVDTGGGMST